MPEPARSPQALLEEITQQQARVATLTRALQAVERVVGRADAGTLARAHRRADDALLDLEAAEAVLDRLLQAHAATTTAPRTAIPHPRRHCAGDLSDQAALFDLG